MISHFTCVILCYCRCSDTISPFQIPEFAFPPVPIRYQSVKNRYDVISDRCWERRTRRDISDADIGTTWSILLLHDGWRWFICQRLHIHFKLSYFCNLDQRWLITNELYKCHKCQLKTKLSLNQFLGFVQHVYLWVVIYFSFNSVRCVFLYYIPHCRNTLLLKSSSTICTVDKVHAFTLTTKRIVTEHRPSQIHRREAWLNCGSLVFTVF